MLSPQRRNHKRSQSGAAIAFTTVLAFVLVVIGVAFLIFSLYMGGQRETKNTVDAAELNVGKQALDQINVQLDNSEGQQFFYDITNNSTDNTDSNDGNINLRRINRMWGKAMLVGINAAAADQDGNAGSADASADQAAQSANAISNTLAAKLELDSNLQPFFSDVASSNSVRMVGEGASVKVLDSGTAAWTVSRMDRGCESNLMLSGSAPTFNLPPNFSLPAGTYTQCTRSPKPQDAGNTYFLKGYTPLTIGNNTFWQVPYQFEEKPHLVSQSIFQPNSTASVSTWNNPVPNAFSGSGEASKPQGTAERATSWVLTNPNQPFKLSIPHSFVHIHLDQLEAKFLFFPSGYPPTEWSVPDENYGYTTNELTPEPGLEAGILCAIVDPGSVEVGEDVVGKSLDGIIFGSPGGDSGDSQLEAYMTNRMNEMVGQINNSVPVSFSASDLHSMLSDPSTTAALLTNSVNDFYMFSPDGKKVVVQTEQQAELTAPWLAAMIDNDPEGTETQLVNDESTIDPFCPPPFGFTPDVTPDPDCENLPPPAGAAGWQTWEKSLYWTPGTGFKGNLGTVRVQRWTNVYSWGVCITTVI